MGAAGEGPAGKRDLPENGMMDPKGGVTMKHIRILAGIAAACLLLAACSGEPSSPAEEASQPEESSVSQVQEESSASSEESAPAVEITVEEPNVLLGTCRWGDGYLALMEVPAEFNRIQWRTYDSEGAQLTQGDIGWGNSYPIGDLPRSPLEAGDGIVSFTVEMPADYNGAELCRRFTIAIDDDKVDEVAVRPAESDDRYSLEDWYPLARDGETVVEWQDDFYDGETGQLVPRMRLRTGWTDATQPVEIRTGDPSVYSCLYATSHRQEQGEDPWLHPYTADVTLDAQSQLVKIDMGKMVVTVAFAADNVTTHHSYTNDMLQSLVAQSPSGQWQVYTAGEYQLHESPSGCDYVSVGMDGGIHYLFSGSEVDQVDFVGEDTIVVNSVDALTFYNPATGLKKEIQPAFDFGTATYNDQKGTAWAAIGMKVDKEHQLILLAYRENTFGNRGLIRDGEEISEFPVRLAVMDYEGKVLEDVDTGAMIHPYGKISLEQVGIVVTEQLTAQIVKYQGGEYTQEVMAEIPLPITR